MVQDSIQTMATNAIGLCFSAVALADGYKLGHISMYPDGITKLYSNFTPRSNKHFPDATRGAVVFGIQYFIKKYLVEEFNKTFFNRPKAEVVAEYDELLHAFLGEEVAKKIGTSHIEALHDLGYLPIRIKAMPEGTYCPFGVPMLTITNTHKDFAWLTNYLETLISTEVWKPTNSATIADVFKRELVRHAKKTGFYDENDWWGLAFQCHDFSMRGMSGVEDSMLSGMAHLTSFGGTECVPALFGCRHYYGSSLNVAGTVPASEHSVECAIAVDENGVPDDEVYFKQMLDKFPNGFVSIVSDGFDYWNVIKNIVPKYKMQIISRDGRVVIRPDSGDPVKIVCGDPEATDPFVRMGTYEALYTIFGGTINEKGYKVLDPHIGIIYGDAINMKRQREIYRQLEAKGFAATNIVLGIGSFTYNCSTRDNLGQAMKATYCEINGKPKEIFKDPKTVVGMPKKSLRGLIKVDYDENGNIVAYDRVTPAEENEGILRVVFEDGQTFNEMTLEEIRNIRSQSVSSVVTDETI